MKITPIVDPQDVSLEMKITMAVKEKHVDKSFFFND